MTNLPCDVNTLFDAAARVHRVQPTSDTLVLLMGVAVLLSASPVQAPALPQPSSAPFATLDVHEGDFREIRATFDRPLSGDEALTAAACTGYALKKYFNAEPMGEPILRLRVENGRRFCEVVMPYDSSERKRSNPNVPEAFELAATYIAEGTPVRTSDRAGVGTKGTRLSEGIGPVGVRFEVR